MEKQGLKSKLPNKISIGDSSGDNQGGTVTMKMTPLQSNCEQVTCKEQFSKAEHMQIRHTVSKLKHKGKAKSIFVKTMDKSSPSSNLGPANGSPVTKDPELVVLCSMLDEAHTNAIMRLHLQEKLKETGKNETQLSRALKKFYSKLMESEYRLTMMQCDQSTTKTIMANLAKDRKKIINFIGGEEVAVRLVEQRQNKCKERKERIEQYVKVLHKTPKGVYFQDDEMDEDTRDKILEELTLEIKADVEQYIDKKYQTEIYEKLLNNIKATQLVEELECYLLLKPSANVEEWLEEKWKELAELKGTRKATEIMEIVDRTMVEESIMLKSFCK